MRRKNLSWVACALLSIVMAASLAGCGGDSGSGGKATASAMDKEHVYSYEELELPVKLDDVRGMFYRNDRIYVVGVSYEEYQNIYLCSTALDGTDGKSVLIRTGFEPETQDSAPTEEPVAEDGEVLEEEETTAADETAEVEEAVDAVAADTVAADTAAVMETGENINVWVNSVTMDSNAVLYGIVEIYRDYEDENGEYVSESKLFLMSWSPEGEILWSKDLKEGRGEDEYFYVNNLFADKEGILWLCGNNEIQAYDAQGNQVKQAKFPEDINGSMYTDREGELLLIGWNQDYTKQNLKELDKNTMTFGPEKEFPSNLYNYGITSEGNQYDFLLTDTSSVYGYNVGDAEPTELMDLIDSDLDAGGLNYVCLIDDTHLVASYSDPVEWNCRVAVFTKIPPEEVKEKTPITLAGMYINSDMRSRVIEFNKSNDTYRIQLKEYRTYATTEDYMAGYTQLNNDIIAGKVPDILLIDETMPFDSYVAKGLIADLYPLLEKDEELKKEDYLENILDAFTIDGKLYQMVPSFQVWAVLGKTSVLGERTGWNMQEFKELEASLPEGTHAFAEDMTRDTILSIGLMMTRNEYIDSQSGQCYFDSQGFIDFLEFVNEFPAEFDSSVYDDENYWEKQESAYREDRVILNSRYFSSYSDFNREEKGSFGEDVTLIGFPTEGKNGNAIMPSLNLALSAKSKSLDGAWEFVRYYLTDEYQDKLEYQFPIKKSALEKQEQEATEKPYWLNEDGSKEYYDDYYYINGMEIKLDPMTAEEAAEFTEFLKSLSLVGSYDQSMMDIVTEEAAAYFEGQKSVQDVAGIIQSRMKIYISENR